MDRLVFAGKTLDDGKTLLKDIERTPEQKR